MNFKKLKPKDIMKILIVAVPIVLIGLLFGKETIVFIFILSAIILDFVVFLFPAMKYFGIELTTFTTVLIGFVYGPAAGAVAGLILLVLHLLIARYTPGFYMVWLIPEYMLAGFFSGLLKEIGFATLGVYSTIAINAINIFLSIILDKYSASEIFVYSLTNVLFNVFIFSQLGSIAGLL